MLLSGSYPPKASFLCGQPPSHLPMRSSTSPHPGAVNAYLEKRLKVREGARQQNMYADEWKTQIRKQLQKVALLPSSYDTAWVAMVPLCGSPQVPRFPQCVEWILQNQHRNGSWGLDPFDSSLSNDVLSSTLARVLALKRWNVGNDHIKRGLQFIGRNFSDAMDERIVAPTGFDIIFPFILSFGIEMRLEFPLRQTMGFFASGTWH